MLADRFRTWYKHERDCNAKTLAMLNSVPEERRSDPAFQRAIDLMTHLIAARRNWIHRLRYGETPGDWIIPSTRLEQLGNLIKEIEQEWDAYLKELDDADLAREFTWKHPEGGVWRWNVEELLTQVNGHAWYHRGQIVQLIDSLGGKAVDTDLIFWTPNIKRIP